MTPIGIMQGRLLPPYDGRFQAFPARSWRQEFALGQAVGIDCIEWIYEVPGEAENPLGTDAGLDALRALTAETGVNVRSVCADYYMERRLVGRDGASNAAAIDHLRWLIVQAARLDVRYIVLPFVDASALNGPAEYKGVVSVLTELAPLAAAAGVELHLETALPPRLFVWLLEQIGQPQTVRANYDIGNSASLGYDQDDELRQLGPWLGSVHVKDRLLGGGTVALGTGNADMAACFRRISEAGFNRWFILQAARGEAGGEVAWTRANIGFVRQYLAQAGGKT